MEVSICLISTLATKVGIQDVLQTWRSKKVEVIGIVPIEPESSYWKTREELLPWVLGDNKLRTTINEAGQTVTTVNGYDS